MGFSPPASTRPLAIVSGRLIGDGWAICLFENDRDFQFWLICPNSWLSLVGKKHDKDGLVFPGGCLPCPQRCADFSIQCASGSQRRFDPTPSTFGVREAFLEANPPRKAWAMDQLPGWWARLGQARSRWALVAVVYDAGLAAAYIVPCPSPFGRARGGQANAPLAGGGGEQFGPLRGDPFSLPFSMRLLGGYRGRRLSKVGSSWRKACTRSLTAQSTTLFSVPAFYR